MKSIRELYRTGKGPSSSHTMGPSRGAVIFGSKHPEISLFRAVLFGSLAATGRGHLTDIAVKEAFAPHPVEIIWKPDEELPLHSNGMRFEGLDDNGEVLCFEEDYSVGGGALMSDARELPDIYPYDTVDEVLAESEKIGETFWEYVVRHEGEDILCFLEDIWKVMHMAVEKGLKAKGPLPGSLGLIRKAGSFKRSSGSRGADFRCDALLAAYAYAVSEENACGGEVVTAPTCGSCGVLPAVLYYFAENNGFSANDIVRALAVAGLFGNIVKTNGSICGSLVGCQGEIGTACAMAAAAATQLLGGTLRQIEYAAEMGLEHHLGLTCDPVAGLVQIPCIERNAHAAARALNCSHFSLLSDGSHRISFDDVTAVLLETGKALTTPYKETSTGGLAKVFASHIKPPTSSLR